MKLLYIQKFMILLGGGPVSDMPVFGNLDASPAIIGNSRVQSLFSEHRCPFRSQNSFHKADSLLAQQYHRINRQRALRWNPRSQ